MDAGVIVSRCVVSISLNKEAASVGSVGKSLYTHSIIYSSPRKQKKQGAYSVMDSATLLSPILTSMMLSTRERYLEASRFLLLSQAK